MYMYHVEEVSTGKRIFTSRFGTRARQFLNSLRPGLRYKVTSDRAEPRHIQELQSLYNLRRTR